MKWAKKGRIYAPDGSSSWAKHSALQPTPYLKPDRTEIRVFLGFRDDDGVSRIGFVDVDAREPRSVVRVSEEPALVPGLPGAFDDNGVAPCAVVDRDGALFLYYAGYQIPHKVRFLVFGGLAVSDDGGQSFERYSNVPILDRADEALLFRVAHTVLDDDGRWRIWYGAGSRFVSAGTRTLPVYDIRYLESPDGVQMPDEGIVCIPVAGGDEHRVARPVVFRDHDVYRMVYSIGTRSLGYRLGYAESPDGLTWTRKDDELDIDVARAGWDAEMMAFGSVIQSGDNVFLFYNGNDYGRTGFGYAQLESW